MVTLKDVGKRVRLIDCESEHRGKLFVLKSINQFDMCELEWINRYASMQERYLKSSVSNLEVVGKK